MPRVPGSTADQILIAVRAWLQLAATSAGLTADQILIANEKAIRPALPFLTVHLTSLDIPRGIDEDVGHLGDTITPATVGSTGTVYALTINGTVISYTRTAGATTKTLIATAILALIIAADIDNVTAEQDGELLIIACTDELTTSVADATKLTRVADAAPVISIAGDRTAMLEINGYGSETHAWLERVAIRLRAPAVITLLDAAGLSVVSFGGITSLPALLDTSIEPRYLREFEIVYGLRSDPEIVIDAVTLNVDAIYDHAAGGTDLETTTTITVS